MTVELTTTFPFPYEQRTRSLRRQDQGRQSVAVPVRLISFKRHEHLSFATHSLWRIHSGYVRTLTWSAEGDAVPLGFWSVGDVVGYPVAQTYPYKAECLTTVKAECLSANYPLSREMMLSQIRQSNSLLRLAHCRDSEQRILQFVCWLAEHFGQPSPQGIRLVLRPTHQEIAESIGITRVTVTRLLKSLERKGHIVWKTHEKMVLQHTFERLYAQVLKCRTR